VLKVALNHAQLAVARWSVGDVVLRQLLEAETLCMLFRDNAALCSEVTERVVQHFIRCIETHGRHMQYLKFLQTIVKSENTYIRKCQDMVMSEVIHNPRTHNVYWPPFFLD